MKYEEMAFSKWSGIVHGTWAPGRQYDVVRVLNQFLDKGAWSCCCFRRSHRPVDLPRIAPEGDAQLRDPLLDTQDLAHAGLRGEAPDTDVAVLEADTAEERDRRVAGGPPATPAPPTSGTRVGPPRGRAPRTREEGGERPPAATPPASPTGSAETSAITAIARPASLCRRYEEDAARRVVVPPLHHARAVIGT